MKGGEGGGVSRWTFPKTNLRTSGSNGWERGKRKVKLKAGSAKARGNENEGPRTDWSEEARLSAKTMCIKAYPMCVCVWMCLDRRTRTICGYGTRELRREKEISFPSPYFFLPFPPPQLPSPISFIPSQQPPCRNAVLDVRKSTVPGPLCSGNSNWSTRFPRPTW